MWRSEDTSNVGSLLSSYNQTQGMGCLVFSFHLPFHCWERGIIDTYSMCKLAWIWLCVHSVYPDFGPHVCEGSPVSSDSSSQSKISNFKLFQYSLVWHLTFSLAKLQFYTMSLLSFTFLSYCAESPITWIVAPVSLYLHTLYFFQVTSLFTFGNLSSSPSLQ